MYAIVAGGGKVGYYLAKELVEQGHEVLIIEKDARRCRLIEEELGNVVMEGDAAEASRARGVRLGARGRDRGRHRR